MIELIITCGATLGDLLQVYRGQSGDRLPFEKLWPGDARGAYGEYLIWVTPEQAQTVSSRYSSVVRKADAAPIDEG